MTIMIQTLIEKYEKQLVRSAKLSVECRDEKLTHRNAYHNGIIQALESVIKDLRELEGKTKSDESGCVPCPECKEPMVLMSGHAFFNPDEEPYKSGERKRLHLEVDEHIHCHYCENCDKIKEVWID